MFRESLGFCFWPSASVRPSVHRAIRRWDERHMTVWRRRFRRRDRIIFRHRHRRLGGSDGARDGGTEEGRGTTKELREGDTNGRTRRTEGMADDAIKSHLAEKYHRQFGSGTRHSLADRAVFPSRLTRGAPSSNHRKYADLDDDVGDPRLIMILDAENYETQ